jgi:2-polyprenyl-3-methyl-5-hydroxy-6-metoxy-1,4-benzoquinol methylase
MAEAFPGLDDHYPPEAVAHFCHPQEAVTVARHLLADRDERQRMRALAEDHTWRHHTWDDRIIALLEAVRRLPAVRTQRQQQVELWEMRARHLGVRAVGYYRWDNGRFEQETRAWWQRLWPYLERQGPAAGARILDFGCGAGRFSTRLDAEGYRVAGVDISPTLLRLASATSQSGLTYLQITPGESLPFADHTFDALWVCTALQHISAAFFPAAVNELKRILRPQALVLLCENTEQSKGSKSTTGHVTFRRPETYISAFPGITPVDSFTNAGERHTVFIGRLGAKSHDIVVD